MTWSQMSLFARAARIAALQDYQMLLSIAHNPMRKDPERFAMKLANRLSSERSGKKARRGVPVSALEDMFGPAKRVTASKEELLAKAKPRGTFKR